MPADRAPDTETRTVLSVMAHPDDTEILCGGTLALFAERGWAVHIATMSPGDAGTPSLAPEEIASIRREEGAVAASLIAASYHCLELRDLRMFYNEESVRRGTTLLRKLRPDVVITHSPDDYMLDHEETSRIIRAACFNAGVPNAPVERGAEEPPLGAIPTLLYADPIEGIDIFGAAILPTLLVDVSAVAKTKFDMLACHESQREWLRQHHGMDEYVDSARRWSAGRGELIGVEYAEGFRQHLGHPYPRENVLKQVLGDLTRERSTG